MKINVKRLLATAAVGLGLMFLVQWGITHGTLVDKRATLLKTEVILKETKVQLANKKRLVNKLNNSISQLEAVRTRSEDDISDYIQTYYKTVAPVIARSAAMNILLASETHDVPFVAIVAVMEVESQFNPAALSSKGARGLMQVMPKYWLKELGLKSKYDLHNIETNINAGAYIMRKLLDATNNNMKQTLYKYVGGDTSYVHRVYENMGKFVMFRSFANLTPDRLEPGIPASGAPEAVKIAAAATEFIHTIKYRGEMLGTIAKWYTGDMNNWKEILKVNPQIVPEYMQIGTKIIIPRELVKTITPMTKEFVMELSKVKEKNNEPSERTN